MPLDGMRVWSSLLNGSQRRITGRQDGMINLRNTHRQARTAPSVPSVVIASARGLVKTYGGGATAVHALAGSGVSDQQVGRGP